MTISELTTASTAAIRKQLELLERERASAALNGLADNDVYMDDLLDELEAVRSAYVSAAVMEIASMRAAFNAPLLG
jgi:hypothetical protein